MFWDSTLFRATLYIMFRAGGRVDLPDYSNTVRNNSCEVFNFSRNMRDACERDARKIFLSIHMRIPTRNLENLSLHIYHTKRRDVIKVSRNYTNHFFFSWKSRTPSAFISLRTRFLSQLGQSSLVTWRQALSAQKHLRSQSCEFLRLHWGLV